MVKLRCLLENQKRIYWRTISVVAIVGASLLATGCSNMSANMRVGTDMTYLSLKDQREALMTVAEYPTLPQGAQKLGEVDASRCHQNTLQGEPNIDVVKQDLRIAAYVRGATGVTNVRITSESALLLNCWFVITGRADAFRLAPDEQRPK
jgi:hypothetical protein